MKYASFITTVLSKLNYPKNEFEKTTDDVYWTGNNEEVGMEKSDDIFSTDHECINFATVPSKVNADVEITFISRHFTVATCINIPVTSCFLLTYIRGSRNNIQIAWISSLS